jgi:NAD(P)H dehydrogenase (quinone)
MAARRKAASSRCQKDGTVGAYAIIGTTGNVGGAAAKRLLQNGERVRAIVRTEAKAKLWRDRGAELAVATLDDASALTAAFTGMDGVFVMTPTWSAADDMFAENAKALMALCQALRAAALSKVVLLSSIGADKSRGTGAILKLYATEAAFNDLPAVTSIRAGWFMENFAGLIPQVRDTGVLPSMLAPLDRPVPMVATADIGEKVADVLAADWSGQRIIELEGPRRYTPNDVAAAFATVLGRPVKAQILPEIEWRPTYRSWGLTPCSSEAMAEMLAGFNSGLIAYRTPEATTTHGLTSLEAVLGYLIAA